MEIIVIRIEYKFFLLFGEPERITCPFRFSPAKIVSPPTSISVNISCLLSQSAFVAEGSKENQSPRICPKQPSIIQTAYRTTITYRKIIIESILPISNRHHSDIISGPSISDTIIYHTAYMSIGQSVLQGVYSFPTYPSPFRRCE